MQSVSSPCDRRPTRSPSSRTDDCKFEWQRRTRYNLNSELQTGVQTNCNCSPHPIDFFTAAVSYVEGPGKRAAALSLG